MDVGTLLDLNRFHTTQSFVFLSDSIMTVFVEVAICTSMILFDLLELLNSLRDDFSCIG